MAKPIGRIVQWKPTFKLLSTLSKISEHNSYQWLNLPTIMPRILAPATRLFNLITDIILEFLIKKILIPIQSQNLQKNYPPNSKI